MRRLLAATALLLATVLATLAVLAYTAHESVLHPNRASEVVAHALDRPEVREQILARAVPDYSALPSSHRSRLDQVVSGPRLEGALDRVTVDPRGRVDLTPVRQEVTRELEAAGYSELATRVAETSSGSASYRLPRNLWQPYRDARQMSWTIATWSAAVAALLLLLGIAVSSSRRGTMRSAAFGLLVAGAGAVGLLWAALNVAPALVGEPYHSYLTMLGGSLEPYLQFLTAPLLLLGAGAVGLLLGSFLMPRRRGRMT
jgi:hypothetical protein